ncbi:MAG: alpha/beta fold hydrolase [Clostridia bacterium]|nr:alpha/beta fold hydrolase [Clostridia bacterium]
MKKSVIRKTLSILLCLTLIFSFSAVAFATPDVTPVIIVSGMGSRPMTDAETGKQIFPPEAGPIVKGVFLALGPVLLALMRSPALFDKYGAKQLHEMLGGLACDEDGNSVRPVESMLYPESVDHYKAEFENETKTEVGMVRKFGESIGWENTYFFNYDWRMSPLDIADDLDVMVQHVKEEKNVDRVDIIALSMGGCVMTAYLAKYGSDSIHNLVMASTAFQGVDMVGALFTGDMQLTVTALLDYFVPFLASLNLKVLPKVLARMSAAAKKDGMETTNAYLQDVVNGIQPAIYEQILMDTFARSLGVWSFIPADQYDEAKAYIAQYATVSDAFMEKAEAMRDVQVNAEKLLKKACENGTNVYIVGAYGFAGIPVTSKAENHTDNLIDTYHMTGGCTVAPYGKTLNDVEGVTVTNGCGNKSHYHVSTDGVIYAGACMFPETTWIIKGMSHVEFGYDHETSDLALWLTTAKDPVDIHTDARYPQFTELDRSSGKLISLTQVNGQSAPEAEQPAPTFLQKIADFFNGLLEKVKSIFQR